ncbi:hypothetical protein M409DRAFT_57217 [Zasmidium cellare ATCC 36951]|uniref:FAD-binding FR-type domain-containing protein n=1 Tax=Zasmidium cellare ATCC 36951 TaxID=1080233 RepID=A0A6A6CCS8_ZASCE|nr:uncharacterized protein M409DRAFT_57217 [Zasmidium cellare ATCC 36951]KAF2163722.1 hypothetical protein M409DRAFT_57217 [Zasmidium cellare ATCC 36951]
MAHSSPDAAAEAAEKAMYALFAKWQALDEVTARIFGIAIGSLIIVFAIGHWTERLFSQSFTKPSTLRSLSRAIVRPLVRLHGPRTIFGITFHPGRMHIIFAYIAINIVMVFHDHPENAPMQTIIAKRFGWLALCNMCLAVFLGLKNTPLSPLAGRSFDAVNSLHRCCGYVTVLLVVLHAIVYVAGLANAGALTEVMTESANIAGAVAGVFMVLIFITAIGFVRRRQYEFFYAMHLVLVAGILITVGLHRPDLSLKAAIITILAGSMWFADKSLRLSRWIFYGYNNHCTLTPLPDEGVRITMRRPMRAAPGSVAFIWVPGVRLFQRHPFTLVQSQPCAEFVVKARDGFTRDLYKAACKNPLMKFRAALEGPYGNVPDANQHDKVVIFAGGSGITFAMSQALDWAKKRRTPKEKGTLDLIWTVRRRANFEWFKDELADVKSNNRVNLHLYVSGPNHEQYVTEESDLSMSSDLEKTADIKSLSKELQPSISSSRNSSESALSTTFTGRPDVAMIIRQAVEGQSEDERVLVTGCGPTALLTDIRRAVAENTVSKAPSVKMHLEEFSF